MEAARSHKRNQALSSFNTAAISRDAGVFKKPMTFKHDEFDESIFLNDESSLFTLGDIKLRTTLGGRPQNGPPLERASAAGLATSTNKEIAARKVLLKSMSNKLSKLSEKHIGSLPSDEEDEYHDEELFFGNKFKKV